MALVAAIFTVAAMPATAATAAPAPAASPVTFAATGGANWRAMMAALMLTSMSVVPATAADDSVGSMAKQAAWFPVQMAGVGTGMVIGIPIAIVRRTGVNIRELTAGAADKIGGKEHIHPNLFASVYSVPVGTLVGVSEGVYMGGRNSFKAMEKPFSATSISMGDMD